MKWGRTHQYGILRTIAAFTAAFFMMFVASITPIAEAAAATGAPVTPTSNGAPVSASTGGQAFSIAPPLLSLKANPGQTVTAQIQLTNVSNAPMVMTAQANDFAAKDESGDPNIILNTSKTVPYSLRSWIQLPAQFTLAAKQTKTLNVPIVVPKSGEPGGHYGVIRFTGAAPGASGASVSLSASIGSLILLEVSGNIQERASLADFYAGTNGVANRSSLTTIHSESFFQHGPIAFVARVSNDGNIHLQPTGTITVKNIFGKQIATLRVNGEPGDSSNPPKNVLPSSIRRFDLTLSKKWLFGRYTAHLDLAYGTQGKHLTADKTFWVLPLGIILPVLVGLIVVIVALRFGIKKYNAHIIKRSQTAAAPPPTKDSRQ